MKKRSAIFLLCVSLCLYSFNALAADDTLGLYVGLTGGASFPTDMNTTITENVLGGGSANEDIRLNTGWLVGAKVGYLTPFSNRFFAIEAEYNHMQNDFDTDRTYNNILIGLPLNLDSKVKLDIGMLNLIGRYPYGYIHPYIGVGGGYANVQLDAITSSFAGINVLNTSSGSKGVFAYQVLAGCDFNITKNVFLGIGYKYLAASKAKFDTTITSPLVPGVSEPGSIEVEYKSSNLTLTIGYLF